MLDRLTTAYSQHQSVDLWEYIELNREGMVLDKCSVAKNTREWAQIKNLFSDIPLLDDLYVEWGKDKIRGFAIACCRIDRDSFSLSTRNLRETLRVMWIFQDHWRS